MGCLEAECQEVQVREAGRAARKSDGKEPSGAAVRAAIVAMKLGNSGGAKGSAGR